LQVDYRLTFHSHDFRNVANLQSGIDGGGEAGGQNNAGLRRRIETGRRGGKFVGAWGKKVEEVAAVGPPFACFGETRALRSLPKQ